MSFKRGIKYNMMKLCLIGLMVSIIYKITQDFDVFKKVSPINKFADCRYLKQDILGPEDMAYYNETTIIVGSGNLRKVFALGKPELEQQDIYAILNANKPNFRVVKLNVKGFPSNIAFYAQGINIRKQADGNYYLYAINHAYSYGGERVEIFRFDNELNLTYVKSSIMDDKYRGILNDLIVLQDDRFLITKEMPYPDPVEGRQQVPAIELIQTLFYWITSQKKSYVLDCKVEKYSTECIELLEVNGIMLNGITWDKKDRIWIADTYAKGIHEYLIVKDGFKLNRFLNIDNAIDNLEYIEETNSLIVGLIPKLYNFFALDAFVKQNELDRQTDLEYWASVGSYNLNSNQFEILVQNRYLSKGLSGAAISGSNLFISSWCDISVMVCIKI